MKFSVETFTSVPPKNANNNASELLNQLRALKEKESLTITFPDGTDVSSEAKKISVKAHRIGAIDYSPTIRTSKDTMSIKIYREPNSDWAKDTNGNYKVNDKGRRYTIAQQV